MRRAWLLVTPEMNQELYEYAKAREMWVRLVGSKPARNGALWYLCESAEFADLPASDYPELPRPQLMPRADWIRAMAVADRLHETRH